MVMNDMTDDGKAVLQPINWSAPIEVLLDGSWVPGRIEQHDDGSDGLPYCLAYGPYFGQWFTADGKHCNDGEYVRNVQPATHTQGQTLTAQERLARMEAFVRKAAAHAAPWAQYSAVRDHLGEEASALVAEMEPVVDGDLVIAREMCAVAAIADYDDPGNSKVTLGSDLAVHYRSGAYDKNSNMRLTLAAIRRGRELARGDVA